MLYIKDETSLIDRSNSWIELDFRLGNSGPVWVGPMFRKRFCVIQSDIEQNTSSLDPMKLNKTLLFLIEEQWWLICNPLPNLVQYFLVISFPRESFFKNPSPGTSAKAPNLKIRPGFNRPTATNA